MSKEYLEALECLEKIIDNLDDYADFEIKQEANEYIDTIKQALQNAEKEHNSVNLLMRELDCKDFAELRKYARCGYEKINKQYLKWEDLEFKEMYKIIPVRMGDNVYQMAYCLYENEGYIRLEDCQRIYLELFANEKKFFNDLHLERVEEWVIKK